MGAYVDQFEKVTAEFAGTKYAVATSSGTTALHTCLVMPVSYTHLDVYKRQEPGILARCW